MNTFLNLFNYLIQYVTVNRNNFKIKQLKYSIKEENVFYNTFSILHIAIKCVCF